MAIVSVVGTLYNETVNFTRDATTGNWVGTFTIPDHKGYTDKIELTATNSDGETSVNQQGDIYIFILLSFITDRSTEDINYVQELIRKFYDGTITESELAEWQTDLKGTLNKSDIQRIHDNWNLAITNYFSVVDEYEDDISDILDLLTDTFPLKEHFEELLDHLTTLRGWADDNELLEYDVPETPELPLNSLEAWNNIETIVEKIYLRTIDHHI